ncbi:MAG: DUF2934 domain-containing protein [Tepidisphaeraceae bacterium]|jgi:hypothetical protein
MPAEQISRHDEIMQHAHEIWVREGRPQGRAVEHWRMAEALVNAERSPRPQKSEPTRVERAGGDATPAVQPRRAESSAGRSSKSKR